MKCIQRSYRNFYRRSRDTQEEALISRLDATFHETGEIYSRKYAAILDWLPNCYCHFTSPIRRYPDLQIHRIIKESLRGRLNEKRIEHYEHILPEVAKHSSEMERRADEAERETIKMKKVQYMEAHVGETFEGVISGVTEWGFFVELIINSLLLHELVVIAFLHDTIVRQHQDPVRIADTG